MIIMKLFKHRNTPSGDDKPNKVDSIKSVSVSEFNQVESLFRPNATNNLETSKDLSFSADHIFKYNLNNDATDGPATSHKLIKGELNEMFKKLKSGSMQEGVNSTSDDDYGICVASPSPLINSNYGSHSKLVLQSIKSDTNKQITTMHNITMSNPMNRSFNMSHVANISRNDSENSSLESSSIGTWDSNLNYESGNQFHNSCEDSEGSSFDLIGQPGVSNNNVVNLKYDAAYHKISLKQKNRRSPQTKKPHYLAPITFVNEFELPSMPEVSADFEHLEEQMIVTRQKETLSKLEKEGKFSCSKLVQSKDDMKNVMNAIELLKTSSCYAADEHNEYPSADCPHSPQHQTLEYPGRSHQNQVSKIIEEMKMRSSKKRQQINSESSSPSLQHDKQLHDFHPSTNNNVKKDKQTHGSSSGFCFSSLFKFGSKKGKPNTCSMDGEPTILSSTKGGGGKEAQKSASPKKQSPGKWNNQASTADVNTKVGGERADVKGSPAKDKKPSINKIAVVKKKDKRRLDFFCLRPADGGSAGLNINDGESALEPPPRSTSLSKPTVLTDSQRFTTPDPNDYCNFKGDGQSTKLPDPREITSLYDSSMRGVSVSLSSVAKRNSGRSVPDDRPNPFVVVDDRPKICAKSGNGLPPKCSNSTYSLDAGGSHVTELVGGKKVNVRRGPAKKFTGSSSNNDGFFARLRSSLRKKNKEHTTTDSLQESQDRGEPSRSCVISSPLILGGASSSATSTFPSTRIDRDNSEVNVNNGSDYPMDSVIVAEKCPKAALQADNHSSVTMEGGRDRQWPINLAANSRSTFDVRLIFEPCRGLSRRLSLSPIKYEANYQPPDRHESNDSHLKKSDVDNVKDEETDDQTLPTSLLCLGSPLNCNFIYDHVGTNSSDFYTRVSDSYKAAEEEPGNGPFPETRDISNSDADDSLNKSFGIGSESPMNVATIYDFSDRRFEVNRDQSVLVLDLSDPSGFDNQLMDEVKLPPSHINTDTDLPSPVKEQITDILAGPPNILESEHKDRDVNFSNESSYPLIDYSCQGSQSLPVTPLTEVPPYNFPAKPPSPHTYHFGDIEVNEVEESPCLSECCLDELSIPSNSLFQPDKDQNPLRSPLITHRQTKDRPTTEGAEPPRLRACVAPLETSSPKRYLDILMDDEVTSTCHLDQKGDDTVHDCNGTAFETRTEALPPPRPLLLKLVDDDFGSPNGHHQMLNGGPTSISPLTQPLFQCALPDPIETLSGPDTIMSASVHGLPPNLVTSCKKPSPALLPRMGCSSPGIPKFTSTAATYRSGLRNYTDLICHTRKVSPMLIQRRNNFVSASGDLEKNSPESGNGYFLESEDRFKDHGGVMTKSDHFYGTATNGDCEAARHPKGSLGVDFGKTTRPHSQPGPLSRFGGVQNIVPDQAPGPISSGGERPRVSYVSKGTVEFLPQPETTGFDNGTGVRDALVFPRPRSSCVEASAYSPLSFNSLSDKGCATATALLTPTFKPHPLQRATPTILTSPPSPIDRNIKEILPTVLRLKPENLPVTTDNSAHNVKMWLLDNGQTFPEKLPKAAYEDICISTKNVVGIQQPSPARRKVKDMINTFQKLNGQN